MTEPAAPITLESAAAAVRAQIASLTPDEQTRINYALTDLLPLVAELVEGAAHPYLAKIPFVGGVIEGALDAGIVREENTILAMLAPAA